jgi:hypothetical protein
MNRIIQPSALLTVTLALALPAHATGLTRTFVSSAGDDSNPCTITQPCATFARAYTLTLPNGIVAALDPGKYGPLTIASPVTINGYGWAAITGPASGNAITISANSTEKVALIGLEIDGAGAASTGILFNSGGSLSIQNIVVSNFTDGITLKAPAPVSISNTILSDNTNNGITFQPSAAATLMVEQVQAIRNSNYGVVMSGHSAPSGVIVAGTFADCVFSQNGQGLGGDATNLTASVTFTVINNKIANNAFGIISSGSTVLLAQSTITNNSTNGFKTQAGGVIKSFGNNFISDTTNSGSLTPIGLQ